MKYFRRVIQIRATDSPNVRYAQACVRAGLPVPVVPKVPGVLSYGEYLHRRATWDVVRQCVGLDAEFWEGKDALMYPPDWLTRAEDIADAVRGQKRTGRALGCDPAEGGDDTAVAVVDHLGLIELESLKTPNTAVVPGLVLATARKWGVPAEKIYFDRGGGGKQHADALRAQGHAVQTVGFGESVSVDMRRGMVLMEERKGVQEERYVYLNRRAEMYWMIRFLVDASVTPAGWGIPREYVELRRQLAPVPVLTDSEGRYFIPPKQRKSGQKETNQVTMADLLGRSPDEADAVALAVYGMQHTASRPTAELVGFG